jgi:hypothetical protein
MHGASGLAVGSECQRAAWQALLWGGVANLRRAVLCQERRRHHFDQSGAWGHPHRVEQSCAVHTKHDVTLLRQRRVIASTPGSVRSAREASDEGVGERFREVVAHGARARGDDGRGVRGVEGR